jgi:predicted RNA-binding Zn-ribbon protein involved in translation (DUF1610 family)
MKKAMVSENVVFSEERVVVGDEHKCPACPNIIRDPLLQVKISTNPNSQIRFSRSCPSCGTRIYYLIVNRKTGDGQMVTVYFSMLSLKIAEKGETGLPVRRG